jgi:hypothetical protein
MNTTSKWPPVYDFDSLAAQIKELVSNQQIFNVFYQNDDPVNVALCQGDIIQFKSPLPVIDAEGDIGTVDGEFSNWVIIGNTCDLDRQIHNTGYSHISPLIKLRADEPEPILAGLKAYSSFKRFFIPPWQLNDTPGYFLDFTQMCSVHKSCLLNENVVTVSARMGRLSWLLFHSCIVRYLARDDGRHD